MKIDGTLVVIVVIGIITISGFVAAAYSYGSSEVYPPWVHADLKKPAIIYVPIVGGNSELSAALYGADGGLLTNLTLLSTNSTFATFSTEEYLIHTNYAYKVWVVQQNVAYDFGLQNPSIAHLKDQYYYVTLNPNMTDQFWSPTS